MSSIAKTALVIQLIIFSLTSHLHSQDPKTTVTEVRLASEIKWKKLNPARGDASPQAGTIWGDQTQDGESGFLVKFVDGFASPPHIHNITYRGIVLSGGLHNDDPDAKPMWMGVGSYWTQPAGEVHITSARGASIGYVEIQSGPYLVKPSESAFDNGQRPVNVHSSNIAWLDSSGTRWIKSQPANEKSNEEAHPKLAFLWGKHDGKHLSGTMIELPAGFRGTLETASASFKAIVIDGETNLQMDGETKAKRLTPGCYLGSQGTVSHRLDCSQACRIYIRVKGSYKIVSANQEFK